LEVLKENPDISKLAARRLYDAIASSGVDTLLDSDPRCKKLFDGDKLRTYKYFKEDFSGNLIFQYIRTSVGRILFNQVMEEVL
jgi:serine protein kinase